MKIARQVSIVIFATLTLSAPHGAAVAQTLGLWGGWNDYGQGWQGTRPAARSTASRYGLFSDRPKKRFPALMDGGPRPDIAPQIPEIVAFSTNEHDGTVLIDTSARKLYYILDRDYAYAYPISVGRDGFTWSGTETVSRIAEWPDWHPPEDMRRRDPHLPVKMTGGIKNPLGAVSIYLGDTLYRIHGTNDAKTIGYAASSGCFRMLNAHAVHLASHVRIGTEVKVLDRLEQTAPTTTDELPWLTETRVSSD